MPNRKVTLGGATGAAVFAIMWAVNTYVTPTQPVPAEVGAAITTVATFLVSYFVPEKMEKWTPSVK